MKKIIYIIIMFAIANVNAQNVVFDGTAFKNKLLQSATDNNIARDVDNNDIQIDADSNGEISLAEALLVYKLEVSSSSLTNLKGIESFTNLTELKCDQNNFSTIDVSTLIHLSSLDVSNNNSLISIYAKNGRNETITFGTNTPSLTYICADESQVTALQNAGGGLMGYTVNSYCSITPGGNFNRLTGQILFDANNDGTITPDAPFSNIKLNTVINGNTIQTISDASGNYNFYTTEIGNFTITPNIENSSWFTFSPSSFNGNFPNYNNNNTTQNFYIVPNGIHHDVEVQITPVDYPIVGSSANVVYDVVYKNKGNQTHNGQVSLGYNLAQLSYVSSTAILNNSGTGMLTLGYSNLLPFETRTFRVAFALDASVMVNDLISLSLNIDTTNEDSSTQNDNSVTYNQTASNSSVANSIECLEGNLLPTVEIGDYLHYVINFENTGNQVAKNVTIKTDFSATNFDINSLQILNTTHPVALEVVNNSVFYKMRSANLGGPGGQGGILLKIKTLSSLPVGSTVNTGAQLFFDYDVVISPINLETNNASTTFQNLSSSITSYDASISMYPNPTHSILFIEGSEVVKTVELYDVFGRLLQTNMNSTEKTSIDLSNRETGIYFLKVTTDKGQKVEKIMKK